MYHTGGVMETWKKIEGYDGKYEVSTEGRIRKNDRIIKQCGVCTGYLGCKLNRKTKLVHRVVAEAFILKTREDLEVNHKDGIKKNKHANNLEWVTRKENVKHAWKLGLMENARKASVRNGLNNAGEKNGKAKLTEEIIINIRENKYKLTRQEFSSLYNVSSSTIHDIIR